MLGLARRLERWSFGNAVLLGGALVPALWLARPWPIGVAALASFVVLIAQTRRDWTSSAGFGAANVVTSLRLLLVIALGVGLHGAPGLVLAALVLAVLALDGLDGWLARRAGLVSAFGAHFDME